MRDSCSWWVTEWVWKRKMSERRAQKGHFYTKYPDLRALVTAGQRLLDGAPTQEQGPPCTRLDRAAAHAAGAQTQDPGIAAASLPEADS